MRMLYGALIACLLSSGHVLPLDASDPTAYKTVLEAYRGGDSAAAVAAIGRMGAVDVSREVQALIDAENKAMKADRDRPHPRIWLQTAAVVHDEYAMSLEGQTDLKTFRIRTMHSDAASKAVRALYEPPANRRPKGPGSDHEFIRAWMRFKAAHEQARGQWRNAYWPVMDPHIFLGEDDSELLLARGALNETTWRIEHEEGRSVQFEGDLGKAEAAFRRALELDPRLEEAQLRLGRVLALRGQTDAALTALAGLKAGSADAGVACLARLFEGDVHEGRGDIGRAEAAYRAAVAAMPSAQSAQLALANVLYAMGRRDEAARAISVLATGAAPDIRNDPWVFYMRGIGWRDEGYLDVLRHMVRR